MTSPIGARPVGASFTGANASLSRKLTASLVAAAAVALTTHVGSIIIVLISSQLGQNLVPPIHNRFFSSTLFLFIALVVFGFIGIYARRYFAAAAGIVLSTASAFGGTTLLAASTDSVVTVPALVGSLLTINLPFVLTATVATVWVGTPVWRAIVEPRATDAAAPRRIALVRVPAENLADGLVTHVDRSPVDLELANEQWDGYVTALLDNGWSTIEVEPAPALADSVFVEDVVVVFGQIAVITSPGAESRRAEITAVESSVAELGLDVRRIELPGTLDGGDVLKVGSTVYVGRGGRTNADGIRQLRGILAPLGYSVVAVPSSKVLHLKSAVTALPDGTIIGFEPLVDDSSLFDRFLAMPEEGGAHVVVLSQDTVLMAASAPVSQALVENLGYRVISVDISEFEKLEGCVTCLSVRIR
jgi:dimethylargininase